MDFDHTTIIDKVHDYQKRLFLDVWHSQRDQNVGNEHIENSRHTNRLRNVRGLVQLSRVFQVCFSSCRERTYRKFQTYTNRLCNVRSLAQRSRVFQVLL